MKAEHHAKEAERLRADDVLNHAFDAVKAEALEALVTADADDKTAILRLQQRVQAVDEIRDTLARYIMAAPGEPQTASPYA